MNNDHMVAAVYLLVSLLVLFPLYRLSAHFSGSRFNWKSSCVCLLLMMVFGVVQLSIAEYGYYRRLPALNAMIAGNEAVRWIALISVLLHTCCIPTVDEPRKWFASRQK